MLGNRWKSVRNTGTEEVSIFIWNQRSLVDAKLKGILGIKGVVFGVNTEELKDVFLDVILCRKMKL